MTRDEWVAQWPTSRKIDRRAIERSLADPNVPEGQKAETRESLKQYAALIEANPIQGFWPHTCRACKTYAGRGCPEHRTPQLDYAIAHDPLQAAFCGNQFGKTCILTVKSYAQHLPEEALPAWLRSLKITTNSPAFGYLLCPAFKLLETVYIPELRKWAPSEYLRGGSFDKAWDKSNRALHFADGGALHVFTYEQTADKLVGARLDYIGYDEPPPQPIRNECAMRLTARGGFEMFAMTPVNMTGGGLGWIWKEIWKMREASGITVINGSIHDNPLLDEAAKKRALAIYSDDERRAREYGEFVHLGGMVYQGGLENCLIDPPAPELVQPMDVIVAIDPGLRNAAFLWLAFGRDGECIVFHEELVQDGTPTDYAKAIRAGNKRWGIKSPFYVIDPSARNRSQIDKRNVQQELMDVGIPTVPADNAVEGGVQQVRRRIQHKRLKVSRDCRILRDQAEEYRIQDRPDEDFKVVKENDHHVDCLRYGCQARPWYPPMDDRPKQRLGFVPDFEGPYRPDVEGFNEHSPPMGALS